MNLLLAVIFLFTLVTPCLGDEDSQLLTMTQISEEDKCTYIQCETPNWKQDKCCDGYVCILPERFDPVQRPRCEQKKFLPGFGYNFGYERLMIEEKGVQETSTESPN